VPRKPLAVSTVLPLPLFYRAGIEESIATKLASIIEVLVITLSFHGSRYTIFHPYLLIPLNESAEMLLQASDINST
jgi:hypothetical protein